MGATTEAVGMLYLVVNRSASGFTSRRDLTHKLPTITKGNIHESHWFFEKSWREAFQSLTSRVRNGFNYRDHRTCCGAARCFRVE